VGLLNKAKHKTTKETMSLTIAVLCISDLLRDKDSKHLKEY
jgi:hypothetical protein